MRLKLKHINTISKFLVKGVPQRAHGNTPLYARSIVLICVRSERSTRHHHQAATTTIKVRLTTTTTKQQHRAQSLQAAASSSLNLSTNSETAAQHDT